MHFVDGFLSKLEVAVTFALIQQSFFLFVMLSLSKTQVSIIFKFAM